MGRRKKKRDLVNCPPCDKVSEVEGTKTRVANSEIRKAYYEENDLEKNSQTIVNGKNDSIFDDDENSERQSKIIAAHRGRLYGRSRLPSMSPRRRNSRNQRGGRKERDDTVEGATIRSANERMSRRDIFLAGKQKRKENLELEPGKKADEIQSRATVESKLQSNEFPEKIISKHQSPDVTEESVSEMEPNKKMVEIKITITVESAKQPGDTPEQKIPDEMLTSSDEYDTQYKDTSNDTVVLSSGETIQPLDNKDPNTATLNTINIVKPEEPSLSIPTIIITDDKDNAGVRHYSDINRMENVNGESGETADSNSGINKRVQNVILGEDNDSDSYKNTPVGCVKLQEQIHHIPEIFNIVDIAKPVDHYSMDYNTIEPMGQDNPVEPQDRDSAKTVGGGKAVKETIFFADSKIIVAKDKVGQQSDLTCDTIQIMEKDDTLNRNLIDFDTDVTEFVGKPGEGNISFPDTLTDDDKHEPGEQKNSYHDNILAVSDISNPGFSKETNSGTVRIRDESDPGEDNRPFSIPMETVHRDDGVKSKNPDYYIEQILENVHLEIPTDTNSGLSKTQYKGGYLREEHMALSDLLKVLSTDKQGKENSHFDTHGSLDTIESDRQNYSNDSHTLYTVDSSDSSEDEYPEHLNPFTGEFNKESGPQSLQERFSENVDSGIGRCWDTNVLEEIRKGASVDENVYADSGKRTVTVSHSLPNNNTLNEVKDTKETLTEAVKDKFYSVSAAAVTEGAGKIKEDTPLKTVADTFSGAASCSLNCTSVSTNSFKNQEDHTVQIKTKQQHNLVPLTAAHLESTNTRCDSNLHLDSSSNSTVYSGSNSSVESRPEIPRRRWWKIGKRPKPRTVEEDVTHRKEIMYERLDDDMSEEIQSESPQKKKSIFKRIKKALNPRKETVSKSKPELAKATRDSESDNDNRSPRKSKLEIHPEDKGNNSYSKEKPELKDADKTDRHEKDKSRSTMSKLRKGLNKWLRK